MGDNTKMKFRNFYRHCGKTWEDTWDSACNDRCPKCDKEIEPYDSQEIIPDDPMPQEVKDAVNTLFRHLNRMGNEKEVTEAIINSIREQHRTLQQCFMRSAIVPIINFFAEQYQNGWSDLRNEETGKTCVELAEILKSKGFPFI